MSENLNALSRDVSDFAREREWERFHTPKNLAMAVAGEIGELLAEVQWLSDADIADELRNGQLRERLASEMADVFIYLVRMADICDVDLLAAARYKMSANEHRYPVDVVKGRANVRVDRKDDDR